MRRTSLLCLAAACAVLAVPACGDDDGEPADPVSTQPESSADLDDGGGGSDPPTSDATAASSAGQDVGPSSDMTDTSDAGGG